MGFVNNSFYFWTFGYIGLRNTDFLVNLDFMVDALGVCESSVGVVSLVPVTEYVQCR